MHVRKDNPQSQANQHPEKYLPWNIYEHDCAPEFCYEIVNQNNIYQISRALSSKDPQRNNMEEASYTTVPESKIIKIKIEQTLESLAQK